MVKHTARLATALSLVLAGCASSDVQFYRAEDLPKVHTPKTEVEEVQPQAAKSGQVVITRNEEAAPPPSVEDVRNQVASITQAEVAKAKREAEAELNAKFQKLAGRTDNLLNQTQAVLAANTTTQQTVNQQLAMQQQLSDAKLTQAQFAVARTQAQLAAQKHAAIKPSQVAAIARRTVSESLPSIEQLAVTTLTSSNPSVTQALAQAAEHVITKDNRVVFAIRNAVAKEMNVTRLGNAQPVPLALGAMLPPPPELAGLPNLPGISSPNLAEADLAQVSPAAGNAPSISKNRPRADWIDIRKYKVVVHEDNKSLQQLVDTVVKRAEPFTGPWHVKWKVSEENTEILSEKFSIDVETSFDDFVAYLAQYLLNDRGVKITFNLFDAERIMVVSD